jgi:hypothetical protein
MKKSIKALAFFSTFISLTHAEGEEACRKRAENLLYQKGFINENVCLNLGNYPNISVNHDFGNIIKGEPDKAVPFKYLDSMGNLGNLMHEMNEVDKSSFTEVIGYTDGQKASFSDYDSKFTTTSENLSKLKQVDDYDSQIAKKITVSKRKKLDHTAYQNLLKNISDEPTKTAIEEAYKAIPQEANGDRYLEFHTHANGSQEPVGPSGHFSDMMRNYLLSLDRGQKFCDKLSGEQKTQCQSNITGVISPNLIKNRPLLKGDNINGTCDNRRGVEYRFNFKDKLDSDQGSIPGEFTPKFKIPGRDLQNKMQFAATMDFISKFSKSSDIGPVKGKIEDVLFDPNLIDVNKDRERFKKLMSGSGCENNDYQIDNLRRTYWSLNLKAAEIKSDSNLKRKLAESPEDQNILNAILTGDYKTIASSPKAQKYMALATLPLSDGEGYIDQINSVLKKANDANSSPLDFVYQRDDKKSKKDLINDEKNKKLADEIKKKVSPKDLFLILKDGPDYDPLAEQMVLLLRTSVIGKYANNNEGTKKRSIKIPGISQPYSEKQLFAHASIDYQPVQLINSGKLNVNISSLMPEFEDGLLMKKKSYNNYKKLTNQFIDEKNSLLANKTNHLFPASPYDSEAISYTQTDINACNSSAAALLETIQNGEGQSMLNSNQAKGTKVSYSADQVHEFKIKDQTIDDLKIQMGDKVAKKFIKDNIGHGWICQECGSGLHVDINDGTVQSVSRFREPDPKNTEQNYNNIHTDNTDLANRAVIDNKQDNLSLASLQNLKIYEIPNCAGCNCLKQQSIENFDEYLKNNAIVHKMVEKENGIAKIIKEKNTFEVQNNESCIFTPPVPHSCNYDPTGDSDERNKDPIIWEHFYCKLEEKLKTKIGAKTTNKSLEEINESCAKKTFPVSEEACGLKLIDVKATSSEEDGKGQKVKSE